MQLDRLEEYDLELLDLEKNPTPEMIQALTCKVRLLTIDLDCTQDDLEEAQKKLKVCTESDDDIGGKLLISNDKVTKLEGIIKGIRDLTEYDLEEVDGP